MDSYIKAALALGGSAKNDSSQIVNYPERTSLGVEWLGAASTALARTGNAQGMVANAGVGSEIVLNDFDAEESIYANITEVTDSLGNVFVQIPPVYMKKGMAGAKRYIRLSGVPRDGFYLPKCNLNFATGLPIPIQIGKYKANLTDDTTKLESKSGKGPLHSKNIVEFRNYAQANGPGYQQLDVHAVDLITNLMTVEFGTLDMQTVMQGFSTGQYAGTHIATVAENAVNRIIITNASADLYRVGQTISIGTSLGGNQIFYARTITGITVYDGANKAVAFDGAPVNIAIGNMLYNSGTISGDTSGVAASSGSMVSNSDGKRSCKWRGIEDPFAGMWQFVDGVNINERQAWVCDNADDYASNVFAAPYKQLSYANIATNDYPTVMGYDPANPFAQFAITLGGGATTYYADNYYQNSGQRIALLGGGWFNGAGAGLRCWGLGDHAGVAGISFGGRLLRKPL